MDVAALRLTTTTSVGGLTVWMPSASLALSGSVESTAEQVLASADFTSILLKEDAQLTLTPNQEISAWEEPEEDRGPVPAGFDPDFLLVAEGSVVIDLENTGPNVSITLPFNTFERVEGDNPTYVGQFHASYAGELEIRITFLPLGDYVVNTYWVDLDSRDESDDPNPVTGGLIDLSIPSPVTVSEGVTVSADRIFSRFALNNGGGTGTLSVTGLVLGQEGDGSSTEVEIKGLNAQTAWSQAVPDAALAVDPTESGATLHATLAAGTEIVGLSITHKAEITVEE